MPGTYLFEYAVIRFVPKVEREEFVNLGVILYCRDKRFLQILYTLDEKKLLAFSGCPDTHQLQSYLFAFEQVCIGKEAGGPIGKLDIATRFRWLTSTRSTIVQTSKVHPGLCADPLETLVSLHSKLVL